MVGKFDQVFEYYANVTEKPIDWIWYPYIPSGKITLLQGDPGDGKSTFILNIAAILSNGATLPDGTAVSGPMNVVYQCAEDDTGDTIKPRLMAAGADCNRIIYILNDDNALTFDDQRIEETIHRTGSRLIVFDPIQSFLSQEGDMKSVGRVRSILGNLSRIAAKENCGVVLIGHMTKSTGGKKLYRGLGSIDIAAIARSILMVERSETNRELRYMYPVKSSLAPEGQAIAFTFDKDYGFQWIGPCDVEHEKEEYDSKLTKAIDFLLELLSDGDKPSQDILDAFEAMGISKRTFYSAKRESGIESYKVGNTWYCHRPVFYEDDAEDEDEE